MLFMIVFWKKGGTLFCDICLSKERSIKQKMCPHVPSTTGNVGEKVFIDSVTLSETVRKDDYETRSILQ